ncbi:hypothetical protein BDF22DRAFT_693717, partial [Syncephalis plumigaleata]
MYCDNAQKLVLEAKRTTVDRLPPFNRELVQAVCQELNYLSDNIQEHLERLTSSYATASDKVMTDSSQISATTSNLEHNDSNMTMMNTADEESANTTNEQTFVASEETTQQWQEMDNSSSTPMEMSSSSMGYSFSLDTDTTNTLGDNSMSMANTNETYTQPLSATSNDKARPSSSLEPWQYLKMTIEHLALKRNKRCLMTYLHHRLYMIRLDTWRRGGRIPTTTTETSIDTTMTSLQNGGGINSTNVNATRMSGGEEAFQREYSRLLRRHAANYANIGLIDELKPPKELYVQVRAIRHGGLVQTEGGGALRLEPGTQCYISRQEAERLINLGLVHR